MCSAALTTFGALPRPVFGRLAERIASLTLTSPTVLLKRLPRRILASCKPPLSRCRGPDSDGRRGFRVNAESVRCSNPPRRTARASLKLADAVRARGWSPLGDVGTGARAVIESAELNWPPSTFGTAGSGLRGLQRRSRSIVHVVHRRDCRRSLESLDGGEIGRGLGNVPSTPSTVYRRRGDGTRKCSLPSPETSRNAFQRDDSDNQPAALGVPERQCFPMPVAQHSRHEEHTPWPGEDAAIRLPDEQHAGACRCP